MKVVMMITTQAITSVATSANSRFSWLFGFGFDMVCGE